MSWFNPDGADEWVSVAVSFKPATGGTTTTYTYDNNGNLTGDGTWTNTYDFRNKLTQSAKTGTTVTYGYDHSGQRVQLGNGTTTTLYPTKFYNTDGTSPQKHVLDNQGNAVAMVKGTGKVSVYYDHTDHLTGSNVITNSSGVQEELLDYYPFGDIRLDQKANSYSEQNKFTGQEYDVDTQLSYMNARYYEGTRGKFLSQDPAFINLSHLQVQLADPQSWNSYAYARNNPLALVDPSGNMWTPWQSSGGFTPWMGNGGFLYNVYGSNVNSITSTAQNIQQNGWTSDNIMALGADAASITAKTSGVIVGSAGLGMGAGVAVESGAVSTLFNSQAAVRGGINASINVGSQILSDKVEGKQTSLGDYAKIAGISYLSGALVNTKSIKINALASAGSNALSQAATGDHSINPVKVGAAALGGGLSGWAGNYLSTSGNLGFYTAQQYGLGRIGWSVETPISIINSGVSNKK